MNQNTDFKLFARSAGIPSTTTESVIEHIEASSTPYILEEREMRVTQMDVFSRLMQDRIIWIQGGVEDRMASVVQAQLMFLDSMSDKDITMHISSPGGSVLAGLGIVDVMQYIKSDIATINTGMAASMGSVLLGAGAKGKRSSLRFSRVMLHQSSGGATGNIQDARIQLEQWESYNKILAELLAGFCNQSYEKVLDDTRRDFWLNAQQSLDYGIIDEIIQPRDKTKKK